MPDEAGERVSPVQGTERKREPHSSVMQRPLNYDDRYYLPHLIDQYKLYVEMVDRLSARRVLVNNTFITLTGAAAVAYAAVPTSFRDNGFSVFFQMGISLASLMLSVLWRETIVYYRKLSDAKFKVIHEMEDLLPAQPYKMEHRYFIDERQKGLTPFTKGLSQMETYIPIIGGFIASAGFVLALIAFLRAA